MKDNRSKRWRREHRKKRGLGVQSVEPSGVGVRSIEKFADGGQVRVVYRCKSPEERARRVARAQALAGTPFLLCPGLSRVDGAVAFVASDGTPVKVADVEMVYNDMLLMDAISDQGKDGPLYADTLESELEREVLKFAVEAYAGVRGPQ
jgi:hypothetical protein